MIRAPQGQLHLRGNAAQRNRRPWIPTFGGMTTSASPALMDPGLRRDAGIQRTWQASASSPYPVHPLGDVRWQEHVVRDSSDLLGFLPARFEHRQLAFECATLIVFVRHHLQS